MKLPIVVGCLLVATTASAAEEVARTGPMRLGEAGSVAVGIEGSLGTPSSRGEQGYAGAGSDLVLRPQLDVFVTRSLSIGGSLPLELRVPTGENRPASYLAATFPSLRAGYLLPISRRIAFWPGLRVGCDAVTATGSAVGQCSAEGLWAAVDTRIAFEVVPHAFITLTPIVAQFNFERERRTDSFGGFWLQSAVGASGVF
jgi:hypothetical protein